jgi:hypothetical protein
MLACAYDGNNLIFVPEEEQILKLCLLTVLKNPYYFHFVKSEKMNDNIMSYMNQTFKKQCKLSIKNFV